MTTRYNTLIERITTKAKKHTPTIITGSLIALFVIATVVLFVSRIKRPSKQAAAVAVTPTATIEVTATASPTATPTLTPTEEPTTTPEPLVVSVDAGRSADLTISNSSDRNIAIYWVDYEGEEQYAKRLTPGQAYTQPTTVGHVWRVRDEASGELVEEITIKNRETKLFVLIAPSLADAMGPTLVPTATPLPKIIDNFEECVVTEIPQYLHLAAFFTKYCDANGIAIVSSDQVSNRALQQSWYIVMNMLSPRPDLHEIMANHDVKFAVFSANDDISDLPYFKDVDPSEAFAAAGASLNYPIATNSEDNLLCWAGYQYLEGYHIAVHEFAHAIHMHGLAFLDLDFDARLEQVYQKAMDAGLWYATYASTNHFEYWAEGVGIYFNAIYEPEVFDHWVNTRSELQEYDPDLYTLIDNVFLGFEWSPSCP